MSLGTGALLGGGGGLSVGTASASGGAAVSATGSVDAAGGVSGFSSYAVGRLVGEAAAGSTVAGSVAAGGTGLASAVVTTQMDVGVLVNTSTGAATATGTLDLGGPLTLNTNFLQAGQMFNAAASSTVDGAITLRGGGDVGMASGFVIVGNVSASNNTQVGSQASGALSVLDGGSLTLAAGTNTFIGTTFGPDRDGAAVNTATGTVTIDGTLTIAGAPGFLGIGQTNGGVASGVLDVGTLVMGTNQFASLGIGTSGASGQASGSLTAGDGALRVGNLSVGVTSGGSADGHLALSGADLFADRISAGIGAGGTAHIGLTDSTAIVTDFFTLESGVLALDGSLLTVGTLLTLGDGASLEIDIDGLVRGAGYGAIDAAQAALSGTLGVDLSNFVPSADTVLFDLLRSGGVDGIVGDFSSLIFTGVLEGYTVLAGIEIDGVEVYRLRLIRNSVPEPATLALFALGLAGFGAIRRKKLAA
jgi:hypothetical protein